MTFAILLVAMITLYVINQRPTPKERPRKVTRIHISSTELSWAHSSTGAGSPRDFRLRPCAELGQPNQGNLAGRCRLDSTRRKALARSYFDLCDDSYCHPRTDLVGKPPNGWKRLATNYTRLRRAQNRVGERNHAESHAEQ